MEEYERILAAQLAAPRRLTAGRVVETLTTLALMAAMALVAAS